MKASILVLILVHAVIAQEKPCNICPNGVTANGGDDFVPFASDNRTCAQLVQDALTVESGTNECGFNELNNMIACCPPTEIVNPCTICPGGISAGDDHVLTNWHVTCKNFRDEAKRFESGSDACSLYEGGVPECCPPLTTSPTVTSFTTAIPSTTPPVFVTNDHAGTPDAAMTPAPSPDPTVETTQESSTSGTVFENQCIVCPNGVKDGMNDVAPYDAGGDSRTCVQLVTDALTIDSGTEDCGWAEYDIKLECCFTEPSNSCNVCPDGATAGDDYVPEYEGNTLTCKELIEGATLFESGSDACALHDIDAKYCCPTLTTANPTPDPKTSSGGHFYFIIGAISAISIVSLTFLAAVCILRRRASNAKGALPTTVPNDVPKMPGADIPTAVAMQLDLEGIAFGPVNHNPPPPYAPHASAPPIE